MRSLVGAGLVVLAGVLAPRPAASFSPSGRDAVAVRAAAERPPATLSAGPSQAERGYLDIVSDPPAKIVIDGADTGKTTPQHRLELPVGHHKLTLVTLDGKHQRSIGFSVDRGQTTQLSVHLAS
jgi:hypothetical protein